MVRKIREQKMLCLSYLQMAFMSFLQKHREEGKGWVV